MRYFAPNRTFATMALALFGSAINALADSNCSTATLKGAFAFTAAGTLVAPSPIVAPLQVSASKASTEREIPRLSRR